MADKTKAKKIRSNLARVLLIPCMLLAALYAFIEAVEYIGFYAGDPWDQLKSTPEILFCMISSVVVIIGWIYVFVRLNARRGWCLKVLRCIVFFELFFWLIPDYAAYSYDTATPFLAAAAILDAVCLLLLTDHTETSHTEKLQRIKRSIPFIIASIAFCVAIFIIAPRVVEAEKHEEFSQHMDTIGWVDENGETHIEESPGIIEYYYVSTPQADLLEALQYACKYMIPISGIYLILMLISRFRIKRAPSSAES